VKIRTVQGSIAPSALFRVVATGYALGVIAIFAVPFGVISLLVLFGMPLGRDRWSILLFPVLLPLIAVGQALIFGAIVLLGLTVYRWYGRIEIEHSDGPAVNSAL